MTQLVPVQNDPFAAPPALAPDAVVPPVDAVEPETVATPAIGARARPVRVNDGEDIDLAAKKVNVEPSPAQAEAGNYSKGHLKFHGLDISIENPKGSKRKGVDKDGKPWEATLPAHYGYLKRTVGNDDDNVDVFIGDALDSDRAFIVDQKDLGNGKFDEHKVIVGVKTPEEARALYAAAFSDGKGADRVRSMREIMMPDLKDWIASADKSKPATRLIEKTDAAKSGGAATLTPVDHDPFNPQHSAEEGKGNRELSVGDTAIDAAKSLGTGLVKGVTGLAGLPGDIGRLTITGMGKLNGDDPAEIERLRQGFPIPGSADLTSAVERNVTGPLHEPQSSAGDFANTIGEFAPNALGGGAGLVRKAAMVAIPAVASETAGKLTAGTDAEPYARIAGALAGGGLANIGKGGNLVKNAAKGAPSQEEVKSATNAMYKQLREAGIKFDPDAYHSMAMELTNKLTKDGFRPAQAPMSADALKAIGEKAGEALDFNDFESLRKIAGQILREQSATSTDKAAAGLIVDALDKFATSSKYIHNGTAENAPLLMKNARDFARRNIMGRQIDDMMVKAETYQSGYESGLRNQFSNYLRSNKAKGLTPTERQAFMEVAKGNFTSNTLGTFGKLGVDFSHLGNRAALLPGMAAGGGYLADHALTGGATVAAATGAKYIARKMTRGAADRAKEVVMAGRKAQKEAVSTTRKNLIQARIRSLVNAEGSARQGKDAKHPPIRLPNGSTLWNPTAEDYAKYSVQ